MNTQREGVIIPVFSLHSNYRVSYILFNCSIIGEKCDMKKFIYFLVVVSFTFAKSSFAQGIASFPFLLIQPSPDLNGMAGDF